MSINFPFLFYSSLQVLIQGIFTYLYFSIRNLPLGTTYVSAVDFNLMDHPHLFQPLTITKFLLQVSRLFLSVLFPAN